MVQRRWPLDSYWNQFEMRIRKCMVWFKRTKLILQYPSPFTCEWKTCQYHLRHLFILNSFCINIFFVAEPIPRYFTVLRYGSVYFKYHFHPHISKIHFNIYYTFFEILEITFFVYFTTFEEILQTREIKSRDLFGFISFQNSLETWWFKRIVMVHSFESQKSQEFISIKVYCRRIYFTVQRCSSVYHRVKSTFQGNISRRLTIIYDTER